LAGVRINKNPVLESASHSKWNVVSASVTTSLAYRETWNNSIPTSYLEINSGDVRLMASGPVSLPHLNKVIEKSRFKNNYELEMSSEVLSGTV